jgi:hypothetical protein
VAQLARVKQVVKTVKEATSVLVTPASKETPKLNATISTSVKRIRIFAQESRSAKIVTVDTNATVQKVTLVPRRNAAILMNALIESPKFAEVLLQFVLTNLESLSVLARTVTNGLNPRKLAKQENALTSTSVWK